MYQSSEFDCKIFFGRLENYEDEHFCYESGYKELKVIKCKAAMHTFFFVWLAKALAVGANMFLAFTRAFVSAKITVLLDAT